MNLEGKGFYGYKECCKEGGNNYDILCIFEIVKIFQKDDLDYRKQVIVVVYFEVKLF